MNLLGTIAITGGIAIAAGAIGAIINMAGLVNGPSNAKISRHFYYMLPIVIGSM